MIVFGPPESCPECKGPLNYRYIVLNIAKCDGMVDLILALMSMHTSVRGTFLSTLAVFTQLVNHNEQS